MATKNKQTDPKLPSKGDKKIAKTEQKGFVGFMVRVGQGLIHLPKRIIKSLKDMAAELKKVSWPSRGELFNYSLVVLIFMAFMSVVVGVLDAGAATLVSWIVR